MSASPARAPQEEKRLIGMMADGYVQKEIAAELKRSHSAVRNHISLLRKQKKIPEYRMKRPVKEAKNWTRAEKRAYAAALFKEGKTSSFIASKLGSDADQVMMLIDEHQAHEKEKFEKGERTRKCSMCGVVFTGPRYRFRCDPCVNAGNRMGA